MNRRLLPLLLVQLFLLAQLAAAQGLIGSWTYDLFPPGGADQPFTSGYMTLPADGVGRMVLLSNGIDTEMTGILFGQDGEDQTVTGMLAFGDLAFTLLATVDGDMFEGSFTVEGNPPFGIRAERAPGDAFAAYDARQDSLRAANAPTPVDMFEPFDLPAPNTIRTGSGRPGPDYWQQRADYDLTAKLDEDTHTITGTVRLKYTNNSPETLTYLWFHLEQNLFKMDSRGGPISGRAATSLADEHGYRLGAITINGRPVQPLVTDTRMRLDLPEPLDARGGVVEVVIPYAFLIPGSPGTPRMGRLDTEFGTVYQLAQWFPRVAVFDDVNGWNHQPYLGAAEFYLDYGDYDLTLTVPASHTVVATGTLRNPDDVYTREQRQRWAAAGESIAALPILTAADRDAAASRTGTRTWRFHAESVRDAALASSKAFLLDGAVARIPQGDGSTNNVMILSAYPVEGIGTPDNPGWEEATRYGRASIINNSIWYPYPYPVAISVASHIGGGMEYPMLHFSSVLARHKGLFGVVDHELGHNWYPMIVGSDERRHAWMDEGFNTFMNDPSAIAFYNEGDDPSLAGYGEATPTSAEDIARQFKTTAATVDDEILTYPDQFTDDEIGWNNYTKPGFGLTLLRQSVLGPERFDAAFREYTRRWAFKHPQPADFFRTIEDAAGEDLDWFWRGWFDTRHHYDAELRLVAVDDNSVVLIVDQVGGLVLPTEIEVTFGDGSTARVGVPVEGFARVDEVTVRVATEGRTVTSARLDPDGLLPDLDRANDTARPGN